jgi:hypothetical protein
MRTAPTTKGPTAYVVHFRKAGENLRLYVNAGRPWIVVTEFMIPVRLIWFRR